MSLFDKVPAEVFDITPYQAGKSVAKTVKPSVKDPIKLSSNENPLGTGQKALDVLANPKHYDPSLYPDGTAENLRDAIGKYLDVNPALITCGNGSNEILELVATAMLRPGSKSVYSEHSFIVYKLATMSRGAKAIEVPANNFGHDLDEMAKACKDDDVSIVFVANPNNPTGTWHPPEKLYEFLCKIPSEILIVLDEAYLEYAEDGPGVALAWIKEFENLIITRTFSKIHGLAGLRIGYGIAGEKLTSMLNRIRQPFNANAPAQAAAIAALSDNDFIELSKRTNEQGLLQLQTGLAKLNYPTMPSQGNFLAFCARDVQQTNQALLDTGIVVRNIAEYGLESWLRTTIGTAEQNERLLKALPAQ